MHSRIRVVMLAGAALVALAPASGAAALATHSVPAIPGTAGAASSPAAAGSWTLETVPLPAPAQGARLMGVSCPTATDCVADGEFPPLNTPAVERWNGSTWTPQKLPLPPGQTIGEVDGVSCPSAGACVAVGSVTDSVTGTFQPLAEEWNGSTWKAQVLPRPAGGNAGPLTAVSCGAPASCSAVGHVDGGPRGLVPVVEHWNGTTWMPQVTAPLPAGATQGGLLQGVSCPSPASCTVTGSWTGNSGVGTPLAEQWNGHAWQLEAAQPAPGNAPAGLVGVSCTSAADCTAAGAYFLNPGNRPMAEHWNGSTWSLTAVPVPSGVGPDGSAVLNAISCPTAVRCTAAGYWSVARPGGQALAEVWNGTTWRIQATARPRGHKVFNAISCVAARTCTAVGTATQGTGPNSVDLPLAEGE